VSRTIGSARATKIEPGSASRIAIATFGFAASFDDDDDCASGEEGVGVIIPISAAALPGAALPSEGISSRNAPRRLPPRG